MAPAVPGQLPRPQLMLGDRGVDVDHTTVFRWVQAHVAGPEKRVRPHLRRSSGSWRADEAYVRLKGRRACPCRAVDSRGQTIDSLLPAKRDTEAAKRFFRKAPGRQHTASPRTVTADKNPSHPKAVAELKRDGELWRFPRPRQRKRPDSVVEQDRRRIKRLVRPGLGFGSPRTARQTLAGYEAMVMVGKGQVHMVGARDMRTRVVFIAGLFGTAA